MVDKIPENQLKAINQAKADGISAEERKALEMQGVNEELLEKLSGTKSAEEVDKAIDAYLKEQQDSPSFWKHPIDWFKSDKVSTGEKILAGVGIAGAAALGGWGVFAVLGTKGLLAAGAVVVASGLSSCSNDIDQTVDITIKQDYEALLAALNDKEKADQARHDEIIKYFAKLIEQGEDVKKIVAMMSIYGAKLDQIIDLLIINNIDNKEIIELLKGLGKSTADIYAAMGDMQLEQTKQTELLKQLVNNNNIEVKYLEQILAEVRKGNELQEKENEILNLILDKISTLDANDKEGAKLLNAILAQLSAFAKVEGDMDEKTHELLQTIIANQEKMDASVKNGVAEILAKLDKMSAEDKERFEMVLPYLEKLGATANDILVAIKNGDQLTTTQLEELKKLIMENNKIAQGTQDAVKDMSGKMTEEHNAILEAIQKVQAGGGDYGDLKAILEEIAQNT